jgi:hypothetical protein
MSFSFKELLSIKSKKVGEIINDPMLNQLSIKQKIEKLIVERNIYKLNLSIPCNNCDSNNKIAILMMIVDQVHHEEIWEKW